MILLLCYARRHGDVTAPLAYPQRPYGVLAVTIWQPVCTATSLRLFWACTTLGGNLGDLGDLTAICSAATVLYKISQQPRGDQRCSGWFCRSQQGRRPVWLRYWLHQYDWSIRNEVIIQTKVFYVWYIFYNAICTVKWILKNKYQFICSSNHPWCR